MRLIDADFMKTRIEVDNNSKYRGFDSILKEWIDAQPTVEAIPFEWFYEQFYKHPESLETRFYDLVLKDYLKDQEEENKNGKRKRAE